MRFNPRTATTDGIYSKNYTNNKGERMNYSVFKQGSLFYKTDLSDAKSINNTIELLKEDIRNAGWVFNPTQGNDIEWHAIALGMVL